MLQITVPGAELWNGSKQEFIRTKETTLRLEHSLVSLSKWESKWCKAFFSTEEKTMEETIDYVRCMTITQNVDPNIYYSLTQGNLNQIYEYIKAPMTATSFSNDDKRPSREIVTSEIIYYWMITLNIPPEYQKWHLNRLLALIKVCNIKNRPAKKMSRNEIMRRNRELNAIRRKKLNSKG